MHHLEIEQRLTEHLSLSRVIDRHLDAIIASLQDAGRTPKTFVLELEHLIDETHAFVADHVLGGHAYVVEEELSSVATVHAELVGYLRSTDA